MIVDGTSDSRYRKHCSPAAAFLLPEGSRARTKDYVRALQRDDDRWSMIDGRQSLRDSYSFRPFALRRRLYILPLRQETDPWVLAPT